ncbi:MAG: hypothetical protein CL610_13700 [Anaerolineaceae bacterium]|nr:hypothetical protein [Anaerolineaceae bacterium]
MKTKKLILSTVLVSSLTIGAGAALAQDDDSATTSPPAQQRGPFRGDGLRDRLHNRPGMAQRGPRFEDFGALALMEEYTGLTLTELRDAHQNGQTLAEMIEANGQSVDDFIADATENAYARIDTAVANGRITEEEADTLKAEINERLTARINGEPGAVQALLESYTGIDTFEALRDAHQSGQTLAEIIEANGQSVDDFIADAADLAYDRIDTAVANGRIDDDRAEELKALALERITAAVNGELRGMRMGRI